MADWQPPSLRIRVPWDAERAGQVADRVFAPRPRRRRIAAALVVGAAVAAGAAALVVAPLGGGVHRAAHAPGREVRFHDGSVALLLEDASDLRVDVADDHSIVATLVAGRASFDVVPRAKRLFRLRAGDVVVEVLGTAFSVERLGAASRVAVSRGRVRVSWADGERELGAGTDGIFPPPPPPPEATRPTSPSSASPGPVAPAPVAPAVDRPPRPAAVARTPAPSDPPDDLLRAADAARLAARPLEAVAALEKLLRDHPRDGRAALAAFLLGRIWIDDLRQPARAAPVFARARALAPRGPLVEDTYLREVEAWQRAGEQAIAEALAREYLQRFGDSPRAGLMRRAAGPAAGR